VGTSATAEAAQRLTGVRATIGSIRRRFMEVWLDHSYFGSAAKIGNPGSSSVART